jgi:SAM-dependent methyltransferase
MIAVARELAPSIDWREGVAESLPFADRSFDAVVSQFGLMFFSDRHQALGEMMRVLAPDGRLVVAVWDAIEHIPAYATLVTILEEEAGRAAADALRAPFALGHRDALATLLAAAALPSVEIATERGTARFPDVRTMVGAELRGWLPVMGITLGEDQIERILRSAETALNGYVTADGRVSFQVSAHLVTAQQPAALR